MKNIIKIIISLTLIGLFSACMVPFLFKAPKLEEFRYHNRVSAQDTSLLRMNEIYRFSHRISTVGYVEGTKPDQEYWAVFLKNGTVYLGDGDRIDDSLAYIGLNYILKLKFTTHNVGIRGFYYFDGNTIKIETLDGFPTYGHIFVYYDCKILSKDSLLIKQEHYTFYNRPRKRGLNYESFVRTDILRRGYSSFTYRQLGKVKQ